MDCIVQNPNTNMFAPQLAYTKVYIKCEIFKQTFALLSFREINQK